MNSLEYIGLDIHRKSISFCRKLADGSIVGEGRVAARIDCLRKWAGDLPSPWIGGLEATIFTAWIYDALKPFALDLKVGHPLEMTAITKAKKKSDRTSASTIADLLRANLMPVCFMLPPELREVRELLRFRNMMVRQAVRMHNKCAGMLMMHGVPYETRRLDGKRYFSELVKAIGAAEPETSGELAPWGTLDHVPESLVVMLQTSRTSYEFFEQAQKKLLAGLHEHPRIAERVARLETIPGVGQVTALTWVLEVGPVERFGSIGKACSYCGLTSGQEESAESVKRMPISKQRNAHLQTILVEAAKLAPIRNPMLREVAERERERGHRNRATIAVARKMVAYLMAVDKRQQPFQLEWEKAA